VQIPDNSYTQTFSSGSRIFSEGDIGDVAYVIESGQIEISRTEQGVLAVLTEGQLFGEIALIDDTPRTATAIALDDAVLTVVSREQLLDRLERAEPMLRMLIKVILSRYTKGVRSMLEAAKDKSEAVKDGIITQDTQVLAIGKFKLENELRLAMENNELLVYFQPILDIQSGKWAGFEALTRWNHPTRGAISPTEFIALAEETSLIVPVGTYVLRRACNSMTHFQTVRNELLPDAPPLCISVNVSSKQINDEAFINQISEIVESADIDPACLKLEITESVAADYKSVVDWVKKCKRKGFTVAIDDFGTGYSSLEHLLELDVDTLKVDQAFIKNLKENRKARQLLQGIVNLAKGVGYNIVAEGLESDEHLAALSVLKVDYGQGWLVGKPQSFDEIMQHLQNGA
jgi:EAL domain-containing protein (putative c-di-GMP-specific phosphodiesterase class I)